MHPAARLLVVLAFTAALLSTSPGSAAAQVSGGCEAAFNGVEVDRIDSLSSPLELDTEDILIFSGNDPGGTGSAEVRMIIGPVALESSTATFVTPQEEFMATIAIREVSPYAVGLFRVRGSTDDCTADAWLRVSGRFPLATLVGLAATGLTLGGITGQLGAIASRHRWARSAAALGGLATGVGLTLIGQEFGRLQVSYPSLAGVAVAVGGIGFLMAAFLNPAIRERRRDRRRAILAPGGAGRTALVEITDPKSPTGRESPTGRAAITGEAAPVSAESTDTPPIAAAESAPYWCYVMAQTDVFDLNDHTRTVASLEPGNWYLAKRELGGWVHVVAEDGSEGWVAQGAVHR